MPGKALNRFQSLWGGCQFLVTERKDVEDCLAGGVEGAMSESIFSEQGVKPPKCQVISPGKVCVHEVQAGVLTVSRPHIRVSPGGESVEMGEHLDGRKVSNFTKETQCKPAVV